MSKINLRALATIAGVSIGSASRALKNQPGVSEATRNKVLALADELGYDRSRLQRPPIRRIALLLYRHHASNIAAPFYRAVTEGAERACRAKGIAITPFSLDANRSIRRQLVQHDPDAILCAGFVEPEVLDIARSLGKPMALVDHQFPGLTAINPDNQLGALLATRHLIDSGRQRIALLSGSRAHHSILLRERGYRQALFEAGRLADPRLEVQLQAGVDLNTGTTAALDELLALSPQPDAIVAFNDAGALIVIDECRKRGLRIPEDIAVIGFDDIPAARDAGLSTVSFDKVQLGQAGVEALLGAAHDAPPGSQRHPVQLVLRASTGHTQ